MPMLLILTCALLSVASIGSSIPCAQFAGHFMAPGFGGTNCNGFACGRERGKTLSIARAGQAE